MEQPKNKKVIGTIVTGSYVHYAQALFDSLVRFESDFDFLILSVDDSPFSCEISPEIKVLNLGEVIKYDQTKYGIFESYKDSVHTKLRWALKPVLISYLLENLAYESVLCLDSDLCFFNSFQFLFEDLLTNGVLLTPHWRASDPFIDATNFGTLITQGHFNAGFVGAATSGLKAMDWWMKVCKYKMDKGDGFYEDQGYLNLLPIYFNEVTKIITHKGCNLAAWNKIEAKRETINNQIRIEGKYPVVFIHFTKATINGIVNTDDQLLRPCLDQYITIVNAHQPKTIDVEKVKNDFVNKNKQKNNRVKSFVKRLIR